MDAIHQILTKYWGYSRFRPLQEEVINSVLAGKDTLALMPTGGGKSLCFQVPALLKEGICLVISPLIALMKDQVEFLNKQGIRATMLHSHMSFREIDLTLDNCIYGNFKFIYISPERLNNELFKAKVQAFNLNLIAVDEAHCISQWGYDFRPSYLTIAEVRERIPQVPLLGLTASATPDVIKDIQEKLLFKKENVLKVSFERKNLAYIVQKEDDKENRLLKIATNIKGSGIVYAGSRKRTEEIASFLSRRNISSDFYHAGLPHEQRSMRQDNWLNDKTRVMVCTNAFGMGINKSNVRFVVHLDLPDSIEAYFQEAGRAGRDDKKAYCVLLYNDGDRMNLERRIELSFP
jgi:ATP-dependent DNA helicase RecQ